MTRQPARAVVVGGGVAGLAAAVGSLQRGWTVELLESRGWLGGRAFSLPASSAAADSMQDRLDNGPHVILGCYEHFRRLLRAIGVDETAFSTPPALELAYAIAERPDIARLRLNGLPAPLALPLALWRLAPLRGARLRTLRGLLAVLRKPPASWSVEEWIRRRKQDGAPRRLLWDPMCRAIMNAEADRVSAALFCATLRRAFLGNADEAAIRIPKRPWSELVGEPAARHLAERGAVVRTGARVVAFRRDDARPDRIAALELGDGTTVELGPHDRVLSALPWFTLDRLLAAAGWTAAGAFALDAAPIVSVWFEYDEDIGVPADPLVALVGDGPYHFLTRRPGGPPGHFAVLSGGGRGLEDLDAAGLENAARGQLVETLPHARWATESRCRVTKEARATILAAPGAERFRPRPGPFEGVANLTICGDWTDVGLPSTLEGAAESAVVALRVQDRS